MRQVIIKKITDAVDIWLEACSNQRCRAWSSYVPNLAKRRRGQFARGRFVQRRVCFCADYLHGLTCLKGNPSNCCVLFVCCVLVVFVAFQSSSCLSLRLSVSKFFGDVPRARSAVTRTQIGCLGPGGAFGEPEARSGGFAGAQFGSFFFWGGWRQAEWFSFRFPK